jgi:hypothetical protein
MRFHTEPEELDHEYEVRASVSGFIAWSILIRPDRGFTRHLVDKT